MYASRPLAARPAAAATTDEDAHQRHVMNGDAADVGDDLAARLRRYDLRAAAAAKLRGGALLDDGPDAPAAVPCRDVAADQVVLFRMTRVLARRLFLATAVFSTLLLLLVLAGMYVNIRVLHRQLRHLAADVDISASKMAAVQRRQEALHDQLYDHLNRAEARLSGELESLLRRELWLRDNDKTGLVDFALQSAGGRVTGTPGTPPYQAEDVSLHFLGIRLYHFARTDPAAMLQPDMSPGACWAFRGSRGVAVVALLAYVHLTAFSLEHIPASQAPTGATLSAPKDVVILALPGPEMDDQAVELGRFVYKIDDLPLQLFRIPRPDRSFRYVALRIDSNHGHPDFTCVYRFRVHGFLDHDARHRGQDQLVQVADDRRQLQP